MTVFVPVSIMRIFALILEGLLVVSKMALY